jgi:hypothetical protein
VTDTISVASFLADFYTLSKSASQDYMEYVGMWITLLIAYSSDADVENAKNLSNIKQYFQSSSYKGCFHAA